MNMNTTTDKQHSPEIEKENLKTFLVYTTCAIEKEDTHVNQLNQPNYFRPSIFSIIQSAKLRESSQAQAPGNNKQYQYQYTTHPHINNTTLEVEDKDLSWPTTLIQITYYQEPL
jgi:hypothetical protein